MANIGLLGGAFDPPHVGHLIVAEGVGWALGLDEVRLLVVGDPQHKTVRTPAEVRVELARLAAADNDLLLVDDREVRRAGPTFTHDTLVELRTERPDDRFFFIIGADEVAGLPTWHRAEELPDLATFVAVERPGFELPRAHPVQLRVNIVRLPQIALSSSDLRVRYAKGRPTRYLVPDAVDTHVRTAGLYR